jgi:hypothetical protein
MNRLGKSEDEIVTRTARKEAVQATDTQSALPSTLGSSTVISAHICILICISNNIKNTNQAF